MQEEQGLRSQLEYTAPVATRKKQHRPETFESEPPLALSDYDSQQGAGGMHCAPEPSLSQGESGSACDTHD